MRMNILVQSIHDKENRATSLASQFYSVAPQRVVIIPVRYRRVYTAQKCELRNHCGEEPVAVSVGSSAGQKVVDHVDTFGRASCDRLIQQCRFAGVCPSNHPPISADAIRECHDVPEFLFSAQESGHSVVKNSAELAHRVLIRRRLSNLPREHSQLLWARNAEARPPRGRILDPGSPTRVLRVKVDRS
jgi:hypothetical protein